MYCSEAVRNMVMVERQVLASDISNSTITTTPLCYAWSPDFSNQMFMIHFVKEGNNSQVYRQHVMHVG